jgi:phosphatidylglycerol lysyltransferase
VATQGVINLLSAFLSHPPDRLVALRRLVPTAVIDTSRTFTMLSGLLLLVTALGLRNGKRRAFVIALFLCAVSVPVNLLKAIDLEEAIAASTLMFLLAISGDSFRVKSRELSLADIRWSGFLATVGFAFYAVGGCWVLLHSVGGGASFVGAIKEAVHTLTGLGSSSLPPLREMTHRQHRGTVWFLDSLHVTAATIIVGFVLSALRPVVHTSRHRAERYRVADLLRQYGDSSVSEFALAPDSDYFFSANGRAVIAYRFESNALLAIGDPIGPEEDIPELLRGFARFCREHDWAFAFFQSRPERLPIYEALGWRSIHIGEDPVLHPSTFTLEGSAMGEVRRAVRKMEESGWECRHYLPGVNPLDAAHDTDGVLDQLRAISTEWLRSRVGSEKGFCMGRFDPEHLARSWVSVAWHPGERRAAAFLTWNQVPARDGWALDLMRRRREAPNGTMEFLIAKSVEAARDRGDDMLSLSLSALAKVDPDEGRPKPATPAPAEGADRLRVFLMDHLSRFYDFQGLFHWKKKFSPEFEDRYLVYGEPLSLPRVVLALARAQSPGGLLSYLRGPAVPAALSS